MAGGITSGAWYFGIEFGSRLPPGSCGEAAVLPASARLDRTTDETRGNSMAMGSFSWVGMRRSHAETSVDGRIYGDVRKLCVSVSGGAGRAAMARRRRLFSGRTVRFQERLE